MTSSDLGKLILRVSVGSYLLLTAGWDKLQMLMQGNSSSFPNPLNLPELLGYDGQTLSLAGTVLGEFVCPILIIIGLLTRLGALGITFTMSVAAFMVMQNAPIGPEMVMDFGPAYPVLWTPFKGYALLFVFAGAAIMFLGGGCLSLDQKIFGSNEE